MSYSWFGEWWIIHGERLRTAKRIWYGIGRQRQGALSKILPKHPGTNLADGQAFNPWWRIQMEVFLQVTAIRSIWTVKDRSTRHMTTSSTAPETRILLTSLCRLFNFPQRRTQIIRIHTHHHLHRTLPAPISSRKVKNTAYVALVSDIPAGLVARSCLS